MSATDLAGHPQTNGEDVLPQSRTPYERVAGLITGQRCVILDGATGTELIDVAGVRPETDERLWGVTEVVSAPEAVASVHAAHVRAGCDVLSTNTWGLATALRQNTIFSGFSQPLHWMDVARSAVNLARSAAQGAGRGGDVAVAFSLNGDVAGDDGLETVRLLRRALAVDPPDLILVETLSLVRDSALRAVEALIDTGLPVWLSFRRCPYGVCGVYGEHWGGPEGDSFGRTTRRFEEMGVSALLVNCIPPDHVPGMLSWLRDFTDLPLGVYPNLGYATDAGWSHDHDIDPARYAELALSWRQEGAQIIGGCCGVTPDHIAAAARALDRAPLGTQRRSATTARRHAHSSARAVPWTDDDGHVVFPLPFPDIVVDDGVAAPNQASLTLWKFLMRYGIGGYQRCLDIGSGSGLHAVQLARNGAAHVHAIDIDERAVRNTLGNAFRNGVADRLTASCVNLYPWVPPERYDIVVASLDQAPVDPLTQAASHRPLDYWGRNLVDHLIRLLPDLLSDDAVAYLPQLSILGQRETTQHLEELGLRCRAVDFAFEDLASIPDASLTQVDRVEARSDAYHLDLGGRVVTVAYLLEITRQPS